MAKSPAQGARAPRKSKRPTTAPLPPAETAKPAKPLRGKLAALVAMLERPEGATVAAMAEAMGWQVRTVRGVLSGALKMKRGLTIASEKTEAGRTYRIPTTVNA